jgi:hypothetical protein
MWSDKVTQGPRNNFTIGGGGGGFCWHAPENFENYKPKSAFPTISHNNFV